MRIDTYTKTILTFIALLLAVITLQPLFHPHAVEAQGPLAGVQFSGGFGGIWAVNTKDGRVWFYEQGDHDTIKAIHNYGTISALGMPPVK
jgi:hypothetical protein